MNTVGQVESSFINSAFLSVVLWALVVSSASAQFRDITITSQSKDEVTVAEGRLKYEMQVNTNVADLPVTLTMKATNTSSTAIAGYFPQQDKVGQFIVLTQGNDYLHRPEGFSFEADMTYYVLAPGQSINWFYDIGATGFDIDTSSELPVRISTVMRALTGDPSLAPADYDAFLRERVKLVWSQH